MSKKVIEIRRGDTVPDDAKWLQSFTRKEKDGDSYRVHAGDGGYMYRQDYVEVAYDVFEVKSESN